MQRKEGLVHVLTGDGNGKTTSAVGIAVRAMGRGLRVAFVQFLKGGLSGEMAALERLGATVVSGTKYCPNGAEHKRTLEEKGFVLFCRDCFAVNEGDKKLNASAFERAQSFSRSGEYGLVVLDEIFWVVKEGLVDEGQVLELLRRKSPGCEIVLTGRGATAAIEAEADYVACVDKKKHPFDKGMPSRSGIDY